MRRCRVNTSALPIAECRAGEQAAALVESLRFGPFVRIEQQHPKLHRLSEGEVFLPRESDPRLVDDSDVQGLGDVSGVVGRPGIEDNHVATSGLQRPQTALDAIGLVESDDNAGWGQAFEHSRLCVHPRAGKPVGVSSAGSVTGAESE